MSLSVAFLGDIALDEEDMRMFKVDRIVDLARHTVQTFNHTDAGELTHIPGIPGDPTAADFISF